VPSWDAAGDPRRRPLGFTCFRPEPRIAIDEEALLQRITVNPKIFGGKPIIRGHRLAVEHVLGMLATGDTPEMILKGYPWLAPEEFGRASSTPGASSATSERSPS